MDGVVLVGDPLILARFGALDVELVLLLLAEDMCGRLLDLGAMILSVRRDDWFIYVFKITMVGC